MSDLAALLAQLGNFPKLKREPSGNWDRSTAPKLDELLSMVGSTGAYPAGNFMTILGQHLPKPDTITNALIKGEYVPSNSVSELASSSHMYPPNTMIGRLAQDYTPAKRPHQPIDVFGHQIEAKQNDISDVMPLADFLKRYK